ncbi:MAG: hypothetical protein O7G85_00990, partial [Planctomycetota bacterium]|nr:hypothetical protein [Planctomycetota bacterium]
KEVHLRTAAPLAGLSLNIKELDLAPNIQIPILVHGPFDDIKSEIDPDFDLGKAIIDDGLLKGLEGLLEGLDLGKIK